MKTTKIVELTKEDFKVLASASEIMNAIKGDSYFNADYILEIARGEITDCGNDVFLKAEIEK